MRNVHRAHCGHAECAQAVFNIVSHGWGNACMHSIQQQFLNISMARIETYFASYSNWCHKNSIFANCPFSIMRDRGEREEISQFSNDLRFRCIDWLVAASSVWHVISFHCRLIQIKKRCSCKIVLTKKWCHLICDMAHGCSICECGFDSCMLQNMYGAACSGVSEILTLPSKSFKKTTF